MNPTDLMVQMARNNAWANLRLHRAVGELSADEYRAPRIGFFPSLHLTLAHILFNDLFYVDALEGGERGALIWAEHEAFDRDGTFAELRELQRGVDKRLIACAKLPLDDEIRLQRGDGINDDVRVDVRSNVLLHLFQHSVHHRGQAHAMLSSTRIAPPQLDEFHLREDEHRRAEELRELAADGI